MKFVRHFQLILAARHGVRPHVRTIVVEHQRRVLRHIVPIATRNLVVELRRTPAGIAERHQDFARPLAVADVAQHIGRRGERDLAVDIDGVGEVIVGAVDDKADLGTDRPAEKDPHVVCYSGRIDAEGLQQAGDRPLAERTIDDDTQRTLVAMLRHQNDGALEWRALQCRRRNEQLAGKRRPARCVGIGRQCRMKHARRQHDGRGGQNPRLEVPMPIVARKHFSLATRHAPLIFALRRDIFKDAAFFPLPLVGRGGVGVVRSRANVNGNAKPPDPHPALPNKLALGRVQARPGWGREKIKQTAARCRRAGRNRRATYRLCAHGPRG